jgi:hypothetical protein
LGEHRGSDKPSRIAGSSLAPTNLDKLGRQMMKNREAKRNNTHKVADNVPATEAARLFGVS